MPVHPWKNTLKLQHDLITSNEFIDLDHKNSKLINKGAAGEIDDTFEANAYYLLKQEPPKGWETKRSNTGNSLILFKKQIPNNKINNST